VSKIIRIYNSSELPARTFDTVTTTLRSVFGVPATVSSVSLNLDDIYDNGRDQYNSTALLAKLLNTFDTTNNKSIIVVDVDLFIPVLTFVFGEAQLEGTAAVVSTHRLKNQYYGLPRDDKLMVERLEKEIVHELGHTFGMFHCRDYECVMKASTYVEEIDLKKVTLCDPCTAYFRKKIQNGVTAKED
jgi:archaemetzincin